MLFLQVDLGRGMRGGRRCVAAALILIVFASMHAGAQDQREVRLIAELGVELIEHREAVEAARIEAEHRKLLEEQSRLADLFQTYLGQARRDAQGLIDSKRRSTTQGEVAELRQRARAVIDSVDDTTKQRVRSELDVIYAELEQLIAITPRDLLASSPELANAYQQLGQANDLDWVNQTAILYALAPTREHAAIIAGNVKYRESLTTDESQAINECNRRRMILGLRPLSVDEKLVLCGRDHSADMIRLKFFSHDSPVTGKEKFTQRAKSFGTNASGENIAAGYSDGEAVTLGWWYSPGHLKNMMNPDWKRIGVGQTQQHYTQLFGR